MTADERLIDVLARPVIPVAVVADEPVVGER